MTPGGASDVGRIQREPGSFRDPAGFIYRRDDVLLRQVDRWFADRWEALAASGLLDRLVADRLLIPFEPRPLDEAADPSTAVAVLRPDPVAFISYPYEWTFGELKDAALLTLDAQAQAMAAGFRLRDASAFNVQFHRGRPILIDHLSFEPADPTEPWPAYRQFCEHFLAPLALMAYRDPRLGLLLRDFIDGVPLDIAASLLPGRTRFSTGLGPHLHLHARAQRTYGGRVEGAGQRRMSRTAADALIDGLRRTVEKLDWRPEGTTWAAYAETGSYSADALDEKERVVREMLASEAPGRVWDLGANTGRFSRIAADLGAEVVAWDVDHGAAERGYRAVRAEGITTILPLVVDLENPSPGLGWAGRERRSLADRAEADVALALALVHHLAISGNVPFEGIADFLAELAPSLIIEWVPASDPMAKRLLANRGDTFTWYTEHRFREAMTSRYGVADEVRLADSERVLFHLNRVSGLT